MSGKPNATPSVGEREALLSRYVDDRLDVEERASFERWLHDNPEDLERVRNWQHHDRLLRQRYDALAHTAVPERLLKAAKRASRRSPVRYAVAAAWLLVGGVLGYLCALMVEHNAPDLPEITFWREAAYAHAVYVPEVRHPVEVGADQEAHLVAWLSKRLGTKLRAPHLAGFGYTMVGGRLLPGSDGSPVAQFMYQDGAGHRLTLYVRRDMAGTRETAFRFAQEGKISVFYWLDGPLSFALSGELDRALLLDIAQKTYQQLNP
ncbi:anti-sigma factor family protein [Uliginosibacterium sp. H1]|uniref:anti-sigma factor family protein n=1 Tax=Uliginosibacterium sp. H1 TaxID=3114757 RepID=UPI002E16DD93|nr:anti-sigma factor [Uliginosibacterium sp. H1]